VSGKERIPFGRYQLIERMAVGGMAELYRAVLPGPSGFEKIVAIKKILPDLKRSSRFRKMFLHEGRIMAALDHRNLVQVFEMGEVDDELYMCLEYVNGCDLATIIRKNRKEKKFIEPYLAAWIAREICQGLDYVHSLTDDQGKSLHVVHRDVNPHNVLISRMGDVKLGDFGIAKSVVGEVQTRMGQIKGKMEYLSPEQAKGDTVSPASDLYLVGLVIYEMLTSQRLIKGKGDLELMKAAAKPTWKPVHLYNPQVPGKLEDIAKRALRPVPQERYPSASSLGWALTEVIESASRSPGPGDLARLVAAASRNTAGDREETLVTETGQKPVLEIVEELTRKKADEPELLQPPRARTISLPGALEDSAPKRIRRRRGLTVTLVILLALAAVFAVVRLWPEKKPVEPPPPEVPLPYPPSLANTDPPPEVIELVEEPQETPEKKPQPVPEEAESPKPPEKTPPPEVTVKEEPPPPKSRRPKKKKRRTRRRRTRKVATVRTQPSPVPPEAKEPRPKPPEGPQLDALDQELDRLRSSLRKKGIRHRDLPGIDKLSSQAARQIKNKEARQAERTIQKLARQVAEVHIDRDFVERKIIRLQKALDRTQQQSRFATETRAILNLAINNRFTEANRAINRVFDRLK